ncbi:hypothetical protein DPMN_076018 [Dreissena polymorpha]|uniref:Uncharacterized protein n=1 Tax=Dreissena polymorpha TaxID=45954 RepID=A0A9D3YKQ5_DREPO|nr:hypothetical protein DPMN_076018 [Dreissena polymorpha]
MMSAIKEAGSDLIDVTHLQEYLESLAWHDEDTHGDEHAHEHADKHAGEHADEHDVELFKEMCLGPMSCMTNWNFLSMQGPTPPRIWGTLRPLSC